MKNALILLTFCLAGTAGFSQSAAEIARIRKDFDSAIEHTTYGKDPKAGKYYDIRGIKIYCETYGQGAPLLLIHGNSGSIDNMLLQIPYFSGHYKVIVADSRAQGRSRDDGDSLSYEMITDDLAELLSVLHVDSAYVIGWSDGGIEGLLLAIRHPEKVKKLAVTGANLQPDSTAVDPWVQQIVAKQYAFVRTQKDTSLAFRNGKKLLRLLTEEPHIPVSELHKIRVPVLVMGGDHDVLRPEHTLEIFRNIPDAYLWIFPNSGHSTPVVYADEFNQKIDHFFRAPYRKIERIDRFF